MYEDVQNVFEFSSTMCSSIYKSLLAYLWAEQLLKNMTLKSVTAKKEENMLILKRIAQLYHVRNLEVSAFSFTFIFTFLVAFPVTVTIRYNL